MLTLAEWAVSMTVVGLTFFVLVAFSRALTARLVTGKWPHQCEKSRRIYRGLP